MGVFVRFERAADGSVELSVHFRGDEIVADCCRAGHQFGENFDGSGNRARGALASNVAHDHVAGVADPECSGAGRAPK